VVGGSLVEGSEELPVRVRVPAQDRADARRIAALTVLPPDARDRTAAGGFAAIPLRALGDVRLAPSDSTISRLDGERVNTVRAFIRHGVLPDEALRAFQQRLDAAPLALPPGYRIQWGGESDARGEVVRNLMAVVGMVVVGSVAAVLLTFNSWRLTAVAFVVAGLSMGLGLLAIEVFRFPFGITALIGVIGSVGVSINAAIIIMTALQADPAASAGDRTRFATS
jgi:multidrug efflux pump subunit AcrB